MNSDTDVYQALLDRAKTCELEPGAVNLLIIAIDAYNDDEFLTEEQAKYIKSILIRRLSQTMN